MSKGWESKNVEEQQAMAAAPKAAPPQGDSFAQLAAAEQRRRVQALELQRERVLSERTASPHRRSALENALATIELELEKLGEALKL